MRGLTEAERLELEGLARKVRAADAAASKARREQEQAWAKLVKAKASPTDIGRLSKVTETAVRLRLQRRGLVA
jgi:hypothetical protein